MSTVMKALFKLKMEENLAIVTEEGKSLFFHSHTKEY